VKEAFQKGVKNNDSSLVTAVEGSVENLENPKLVEKDLPLGDSFSNFTQITNIEEFRRSQKFIQVIPKRTSSTPFLEMPDFCTQFDPQIFWYD